MTMLERVWTSSYLLALVLLVGGGGKWAFLRPVPDWRMDLHAGVLVLASLLLLVIGTGACCYGRWRVFVGTSALCGCLLLLGLAGVSRLANGMMVGRHPFRHAHLRYHGPHEVSIEERTYQWRGRLSNCSHRAYPITFGMFLGKARDRDLGCG